ncbi:unnamed protein product [Closterium sp. NIES-53]
MSVAPGHAHTRVTTGEEGEELDPMVEQLQDCSRLYVRLENCLVEHDRDWRKCQEEVRSLKVCMSRQQAHQQQQEQQSADQKQ